MPPILIQLLPGKRAFQRSLLRWYSSYQRDLPWRKNQDPYRIFVSEFMLQQTRVETVIPYFRRFLKPFPTLESLAKAPFQKVLKAWAGLGYYARARNLHTAAKIICQDLSGEIPTTKEDLLKLPGLGPYTAGAVASLAFNQPSAALDGNVKRVLSRLVYNPKNPSGISTKKGMENLAEDLIPPGRASDFNQALMDLGAMICIPSRPRCGECPVKKHCASRGAVKKKKANRKKIREEIWAVGLIEKDGRFFIHRNEEKALLAGLWQFPTVVRKKEDGGNQLHHTLMRFVQERFGLKIKREAALPEQEHFFTHIHANMKPCLCSLVKTGPGNISGKDTRWIKPSSLARYPVSTAMRKIAALLKNIPGD